MIALVLILFGVILIIVNIKAINKEKKSFGNVLEYKVETMSDVDEEIGRLRRDIGESLTELQQEILELRNIINEIKDENNFSDKTEVEFIDDGLEKILNKQEDVVDNINKLSKTERIKELIKAGYNDEEICEKLSLGKGEVLLVRGLFK